MNVCGAMLAGATVFALASAAVAQGRPPATKAAEERAVNLCSTCHGPRGVSTSPEFPILAAQRKEYIVDQLHALRDKSRAEKDAHDFMWGIAGQLDDTMIGEIAYYFSIQPPAPGHSGDDPALTALGAKLFGEGAPDRGIPACSGRARSASPASARGSAPRRAAARNRAAS